jgi:hypothetical protein
VTGSDIAVAVVILLALVMGVAIGWHARGDREDDVRPARRYHE